jgi:hypothetical protein
LFIVVSFLFLRYVVDFDLRCYVRCCYCFFSALLLRFTFVRLISICLPGYVVHSVAVVVAVVLRFSVVRLHSLF